MPTVTSYFMLRKIAGLRPVDAWRFAMAAHVSHEAWTLGLSYLYPQR